VARQGERTMRHRWLKAAWACVWLLFCAIIGGLVLNWALHSWPSVAGPLLPLLFILVVSVLFVLGEWLWGAKDTQTSRSASMASLPAGASIAAVPARYEPTVRCIWGHMDLAQLKEETPETTARVGDLCRDLAEARLKAEGSCRDLAEPRPKAGEAC